MDTILGFIFGVGGLVMLAVVIALLVGWAILATRSKKLNETT